MELLAVPASGRGDREALRPRGRLWDTDAEVARLSPEAARTSGSMAGVSLATCSSSLLTSISLAASRFACMVFGDGGPPNPISAAISWCEPRGYQELAQFTGVLGEERERSWSLPGGVHALLHRLNLLALCELKRCRAPPALAVTP